jgi:creatinine amidohydrolase
MKIALLPIGSTECHGPHLPVETDWIAAEELCRRVKEKLGKKGVIAEILPSVKVSPARATSKSPGTVVNSPEEFIDDLYRIAEKHKPDYLFIIAGHWGTTIKACLVVAGERIHDRLGIEYFAMDYPDTRPKGLVKSKVPDRHGGEIETSLMLRIAPGKVGDYKKLKPKERWYWPDEVFCAFSKKDILDVQYIGSPALADAKTGEVILEESAKKLADAIAKIVKAI